MNSKGQAVSLRRRIVLTLMGMLSITYGLIIINSEIVIRRDRLQRHQRLVMATADAIQREITESTSGINFDTLVGQERLRSVLNDFSATRVLVWLSRPDGLSPIFPTSISTRLLRNQELLRAAGVNASGMQMPRSFVLGGETYFTCSMPLKEGQGVLRFLEDVGVSPASRNDNILTLFYIWAGLLAGSGLLLIPLSRIALRPLMEMEKALDNVELNPSGTVNISTVPEESQPQELQGILAAYRRLSERLTDVWSRQHLLMNSMSHELLTPITLIRAGARRLARHSDDWSSSDRFTLMAVVDEASRADGLIRNFLDIARGEAGRLVVDQEPFDPKVLISSLQDAIASLTWGNCVEFDLKATPVTKQEPFMVRGDIERFRQCVLNIIENASKYSPKNSPIKVTISCDADFFSIYVTDQGPGVPVDEREKVFLPFYRAKATAAHVSGTGVGLAVVKLLMERMGGNVTIENSETSGACFKLSLPRDREHESEIHDISRKPARSNS